MDPLPGEYFSPVTHNDGRLEDRRGSGSLLQVLVGNRQA